MLPFKLLLAVSVLLLIQYRLKELTFVHTSLPHEVHEIILRELFASQGRINILVLIYYIAGPFTVGIHCLISSRCCHK